MSLNFSTSTFFCVLALSLTCTQAAWAQRVVVALNNQEVHVHKDVVTIGDIATVTGTPETLVEKIKALDLDQFENRDEVKQISSRFVDIRVQLANLEENVTIRGKFTNARLVPKINRSERIEKTLAEELAFHYSIPADKIVVSLLPNTTLPTGNLDTERMNIASILPAEIKLGPQEITVGLIDQDGFGRSAKLNINVGLLRNLAVATRDIPVGDRIVEGDMEDRVRVIESFTHAYLPTSLVTGKVAQKPIAKYSLFKASDLIDIRQDGTLVKSNDLVMAKMQQGNLSVSFPNVKVLSSGAVNERVKILNPISGQTMVARVIDADTVLIE